MTLDPYRTLGITRGASAAEIKRAYRQLVKEHHPDSGGPAELPRFLAIQAAYEMLTSGRALGPGQGPNRAPDGAAGADQPWRADPARARAAREAWRRPGSRARPAEEAADSARTGQQEARGTSAGPGSGAGVTGAGTTGAGTTGAGTRGAGTRGAGAPGESPGRRSRSGSGDAAGAAGTGAGSGNEAGAGAGERTREGARHRREPRTRKATPGSTTYDEVHHDPAEPGWTGGSWYGQTSGTYWTINPREYADPRKHGPEYQARARRAAPAGVSGMDDADAFEPTSAAASPDPLDPREPSDAPREQARATGYTWGPPAAEAAPGGAASMHGGAASAQAGPAPGARPIPGDRPRPAPARAAAGSARAASGSASTAAGSGPTTGDRRPSASRAGDQARPGTAPYAAASGGPGFSAPVNLAEVADRIIRAPNRPRARLLLALAGWPPLGIAAAIVIGELTGCARFAASCASTSSFALETLATQAVILVLLLVLPRPARVAAFGSLGAVLAALPALAILTAIGAPYSPQGGPASLMALLGVAWLAGVVLGWRAIGRSSPAGRGREG